MPFNFKSQSATDVFGPGTGRRGNYPWKLFLIGITSISLVLATYVGTEFGYKKFLLSQLNRANSELSVLDAEITSEDQADFLSFHAQLLNLERVLKNHPRLSSVMDILEENTIESVFYTLLKLDKVSEGIELHGIALDHTGVAQQLNRYSKAKEVDSYFLKRTDEKEGLVEFVVLLKINKRDLLFD